MRVLWKYHFSLNFGGLNKDVSLIYYHATLTEQVFRLANVSLELVSSSIWYFNLLMIHYEYSVRLFKGNSKFHVIELNWNSVTESFLEHISLAAITMHPIDTQRIPNRLSPLITYKQKMIVPTGV